MAAGTFIVGLLIAAAPPDAAVPTTAQSRAQAAQPAPAQDPLQSDATSAGLTLLGLVAMALFIRRRP
jgi:hypothetical protein